MSRRTRDMHKASLQQGLGAIVIIVVVAVLAVAAFVGWRLYGTNQQSNNKDQPSAGNDESQTETATYLDVKELRVKIKLDSNTADLTYVHDTPSDGRADGAWIIDPGMKQLDNANANCAGPTAGKIGRIDKSKDANYWGESPVVVDGKTTFKIGEYYYVFRPLQAECSQDTAMSQQRGARVDAFTSVLSTIQAI